MMNDDKGTISNKDSEIKPVISVTSNTKDAKETQISSGIAAPPESKSRFALRSVLAGYGAALFMVGTLIPIFASLVTVGILIGRPNVPFLNIDPRSNWYSIVVGLTLTAIIWLFVALLYSPFTTVERANAYNYSLLRKHLNHLCAMLEVSGQGNELIEKIEKIERMEEQDDIRAFGSFWHLARLEATGACKILLQMFYTSPVGLRWSLRNGYTEAWSLMHQAEEALIGSQSVEEVIRGAIHDKLAIQDSTLYRKDELIDKLLQAVVTLQPKAEIYFKEHPLDKGDVELNRLTEALNRKMLQEFIDKNDLNSVLSPEDPSEAKALARMALREVRSTLNDFRDESWEGIVRARNRLLRTIVLIGIITYSIVFLATVFNVQQGTSTANIIAAASFYIVGGVAGLFGRFYNESVRNGSVMIDDFGLSTTRLIIAPLLSGLAGVGGVLLIAGIITTFAPLIATHPPTLTITAFTLNGINLLVASLIGLMPNLLINAFQHRTRVLETDLRDAGSEKGSEQGPVEPAVTSIIDQQLVKIYHYNVNQARLWFRFSVIAAALGLITILSGIIIILLNGGVLLGIVIVLSGGIPELGAALALQRSKSIAAPLNQRESLMSDGQTATTTDVQEQRQPVSTGASSPLAGSDDA